VDGILTINDKDCLLSRVTELNEVILMKELYRVLKENGCLEFINKPVFQIYNII